MIKPVLAALWRLLTPRGRRFRPAHWQPLSGAGAFLVAGVEYEPETAAKLPIEPVVLGVDKTGLTDSDTCPEMEVFDGAEQASSYPVLAFEPGPEFLPAVAGSESQTNQDPLVTGGDMINYPGQRHDNQAGEAHGPGQTGALDAIAMRLEFARFYFMHDRPDAAAELLQYVQQYGDAEQIVRARRLRDEFTAG